MESVTGEVPLEGISRNAWVLDRIEAIRQIWGFTDQGRLWMESYDFRQMLGQPAWYGSYGAGGWAGAGEANPRIVMHELSHSSWSAFPVEGRPDLSQDVPDKLHPILAQLHADIDRFLRQPPDSFEPLRDRFRNMPNLARGSYPDLHHFGEAELINMTGGNLWLLPPILRKYFSAYLANEGVATDQVPDWASAIGWFRSLAADDRRIAEEVFGLQHIPAELYEGLPAPGAATLDRHIVKIFELEEKQRLLDLAEQFDLVKASQFSLVDAAGVDRGFSFWRSYLGDKKRLHQRHPEVLGDHSQAHARQLGDALDFYLSIEGSGPESQAEAVRARSGEPIIHEFAVLLKPRAIGELYSGGVGTEGLEKIISTRAAKLAEMARRVSEIISAGQKSPSSGVALLEIWLAELSDDDIRADLSLGMELLRETDPNVTQNIFPLLSDNTLRRLLTVKPDIARAHEISPERLLAAIGIVPSASAEQIASGAKLLADNTSGNFAIDRPYNRAVYDAIEVLGETEPAKAIAALRQSGMRLLPWIQRGSRGAVAMMRSQPGLTADLFASVPGPRETPEALLHALIGYEPELAAALLMEMEQAGVDNIGQHTLMTIAFDSYWTGLGGGPGVDPANDARFLVELGRLRSAEWLKQTLSLGVRQVRAEIAAGETDPQFIDQLTRTLSQALVPSHNTLADQLLPL